MDGPTNPEEFKKLVEDKAKESGERTVEFSSLTRKERRAYLKAHPEVRAAMEAEEAQNRATEAMLKSPMPRGMFLEFAAGLDSNMKSLAMALNTVIVNQRSFKDLMVVKGIATQEEFEAAFQSTKKAMEDSAKAQVEAQMEAQKKKIIEDSVKKAEA